MDIFEIGKTNSGVVEVRCSSWLGFLSYIDSHHWNTHGLLYRGQLHDWPIESKLMRETKAKLKRRHPDWSDAELIRVSEINAMNEGGKVMQSYASHLERSTSAPATDQQAWLIGRHQGLLTPFIDWSRSPFVAAFFAVAEVVEEGLTSNKGDCFIFAINSWLFPMSLAKQTNAHGHLNRWAFQCDAAFFGNPRGIAQKGVCTYTYPQCNIETFVAENSKANVEPANFYKIRFPFECAEKALVQLNRMNVNYMNLFPDAFGLAHDANLNLYSPSYSGAGNWAKPPGFDTLIPPE